MALSRPLGCASAWANAFPSSCPDWVRILHPGNLPPSTAWMMPQVRGNSAVSCQTVSASRQLHLNSQCVCVYVLYVCTCVYLCIFRNYLSGYALAHKCSSTSVSLFTGVCVHTHGQHAPVCKNVCTHTHIFTYVIIARLVRAQRHGYKDQKVLPAQHKFQHFLQRIKGAETLLFLLPSDTGAQYWPSASSCLWLQHPCSPTLTTNRNRQYSKAVTFGYFISLYC